MFYGIEGMGAYLNETSVFMDNLLLQLVTFHSYDDLKIIFMTNKSNLGTWEKCKSLPHCFSKGLKRTVKAVNAHI